MESFARALRQLPSIIADNAGFDSSDLITKLRAAHAAGDKTAGLDMNEGKIGDMWALGIREVCITFFMIANLTLISTPTPRPTKVSFRC